jgi:hypothetical protein
MNLTIADADRKIITVGKDDCGHDKEHILQVELYSHLLVL